MGEEAEKEAASETISASGDAIVIADAIFGGFKELAMSVDRVAEIMRGDVGTDEPAVGHSYLDGKGVK